MRPIDANKLPVKRINIGGPIIAELGTSTIGGPMSPRWINVVYADDIAAAPTITPESLARHGRWETLSDPEEIIKDFACSICDEVLCDFDTEVCWPGKNCYFFCPNCGAKMDPEE